MENIPELAVLTAYAAATTPRCQCGGDPDIAASVASCQMCAGRVGGHAQDGTAGTSALHHTARAAKRCSSMGLDGIRIMCMTHAACCACRAREYNFGGEHERRSQQTTQLAPEKDTQAVLNDENSA